MPLPSGPALALTLSPTPAAPGRNLTGISWLQVASPKARPFTPFHSVESCLVASLERFHERDPIQTEGGRRQRALPWELGPTPRTHREAEAGNPA